MSSSAIVTLADVLRRLEADQTLDPPRRREMRSAINTLCRALGTDPSAVPAGPRQLRQKLSKLTAAMAGVSTGRLNNIKSLLLKALKRAGLKSMPGRSREPLAPPWEALRALLPNRHFQSGLSRFMSFCTARGIDPAMVAAETFVQFGRELENSLTRDPAGIYRDSSKLWNLAGKTIRGWPQVSVRVPDRRRDFALPLSAFTPSFREDVETFLANGGEPDVFSDSYYKPLAELTLRNRQQYILMAATVLVRSGTSIEHITGLNVLTTVTNAKALLRFLHERAGNKSNNQIYHVATLLKTIARHHAKQPLEVVDQLRELCKKLKPKREVFTEKNRRCLRQFTDEKKLRALLTLPERVLVQTAQRDKLRRSDAVRVEFAIATAILTNVPIRIENLTGLRLDQHLQVFGDHTLLSISVGETKNAVAIEQELPPQLVRQIQTYIRKYRPILLEGPAPWLFPGESGGRRPSGGFGQQLSKFLGEEVGVVMTAHQFRHLAAKLYLDQHADGFETVRRLLGHKSIETTMRYYRDLEAVIAGKRYAAVLDGLLSDLPQSPVHEGL
jgi:integrase